MKNVILYTFLFIGLNAMASAGNTDNEITLKEKATALLQHQPVKFIENRGQMADADGKPTPEVLFKAEAPGVNVWITETGITLQTFTIRKEPLIGKELEEWEAAGGFTRTERGGEQSGQKKTKKFFDWERIDMELKGANIQKENIHKEGASTTDFNFFYGHCPDGIYGVKEYDKITIREVYPGIDWVFYNSNEQGFKYDFVVHPGADYQQIELLYKSKTPILINEKGQLAFTTDYGNLQENKPVSFYENKEVTTQFKQNYQRTTEINGDKGFETSISFSLPLMGGAGGGLLSPLPPGGSELLVIDPQLVWGTLYGGNGVDGFMSVDTDPADNVFIVGYTINTINNLPVQDAGTFFQGTHGGGTDAFILKFDNSGNRLWATYYGGDNSDNFISLDIDPSGNVFVTGNTQSTNFPVQDAGTFYQAATGGGSDAVILKFDNLGNRLWASHYGGSGTEIGYSIALDGSGNVFVTGYTNSSVNFPLQDAGTFFQGTYGGSFQDAFILKFDNSGNRLWATYYGGSLADFGYSIALDGSGNVFVAGKTKSTDFPVQDAGTFYQGTNGGGEDAFILKFDNLGNRLWATYYGGSGGLESAYTIASDPGGNVFVTGIASSSVNFPLQDAGTFFQGIHGGGLYDAFILKFDNLGNRLWATYYGGSGDEQQYEYDNLAIDNCGNMYMAFSTTSADISTYDLGCGTYFDGTHGGGISDCVIAQFTNNGSLLWASYIGGDDYDKRTPLTVDSNNNLFMGGEFTNYDNSSTLPMLDPGGGAYFDDIPNGGINDDSFILKFIPNIPTYSQSQVDATGCSPCNGSATAIIASCGVPPYDYTWSNGSQSLNTILDSNQITGLCGGNYWVEVKSNCLTDTLFFTVIGCPLPIELLAFDAFTENNDKIKLVWTTATEINNDFFSLERSIDAVNFEQFKNIQGAGNSNSNINYVDYDLVPYQGVSYYRLKQTDFNGEYTYSDVKAVFLDELDLINIYPNPSNGELSLNIGSSNDVEITLVVFDVLGRSIIENKFEIEKGITVTSINTSNLASGVYTVRINTPKGIYKKKEFIRK